MGASVEDAYWTNEDGDGDFQNGGAGDNWRLFADDSAMGSGNYPDADSTLDADMLGADFPPTVNRPTADAFHFDLRQGGSIYDTDFLAGDATVGDVSVAGACYNAALAIGGDFDISDGEFVLQDNVAITGTAAASGGTISTGGTYTLTLASILTGDGFEIDWGAGQLDIDGGINATNVTHSTTDSGNVLTCDVAGTLKLGGDAEALAVNINSAGTVTLGSDITCGAFTLTGGTLNVGSYNGTVYGNIWMQGNGMAGDADGMWTMADDGTFKGHFARLIHVTLGAGVTATLAMNSYIKSLTGPVGSVLAMTTTPYNITVGYGQGVADAWVFEGTVTGTGVVGFQYTTGTAPLPINVPDQAVNITHTAGGDRTWTVPGLSCAALNLQAAAAGYRAILSTPSLRAAAVTLGKAADEDKNGGLVLTGIASIASLVAGHPTGNLKNILTLNSCCLEISGVADGDNITVTTDAADTVHVEGLGTGTLNNFPVDNDAHAHNFSTFDSADNTNVDHNAYAVPGSMALCGVGIG